MTKYIIAWDLGATKCAAGILEYNETTHDLVCQKKFSIKLKETTSLENLIEKIQIGLETNITDVDAVCIGAAGQYDGEKIIYTNSYPYAMHFAHVAKQQNWPPFAVIHDYSPIVCATFTSYMDDEKNVKRLNNCVMNPHGRRVTLGVGTGLGLKDGVLFPNGDFWLGQNEMGHIGISTAYASKEYQQRHEELIRFLHTKHPVSFEAILSGPGITRLYQFFYPEDKNITPEEAGRKMREGKTPELLSAFAWYLGLFVGTVQLSFMPEGGIWMTGGVALHHMNAFEHPNFMKGIESSPAYLSERNQFALGVLCNPEHALIGGGYYATKRLLMSSIT